MRVADLLGFDPLELNPYHDLIRYLLECAEISNGSKQELSYWLEQYFNEIVYVTKIRGKVLFEDRDGCFVEFPEVLMPYFTGDLAKPLIIQSK